MDAAQKQLLRAVVRRVHPDLFVGLPAEQEQNSEALKVLNSYLDELASSSHSHAAQVTFWVKTADGAGCEKVDAKLPAFGSLGPLFYAFGLISQEDLRNGSGCLTDGVQDGRNVVAWLGETVVQALEAAIQHTARQKAIRALSASIKERFQLSDILLSGEFAVTSAEQVRQLEALKRLEQGLLVVTQEDAGRFCNLVIRLHHPDSCCWDPFGNVVTLDGAALPGSSAVQSHVAEDGILHVVAEPGGIAATLAALDLGQARVLRALACFWGFRVQELSPALSQLLGVEAVFCDARSQASAQHFVLWAGRILQHREVLASQAEGIAHAFSLLIHSDQSAAMIDTASSSSLIQVRSDCPVEQLLQFLTSENSDAASRAAEAELEARQAEALLLDQVKDALGASQGKRRPLRCMPGNR
ncbi:hypothetical protein WJX84_007981 [Apatococcus fuscideae]|uniref:DUF4460 domain-containing protein n=1 Tax=Apatococcus fuscideae TaxID=2026836 RepID=A0AAW1SYB5_9CHLO